MLNAGDWNRDGYGDIIYATRPTAAGSSSAWATARVRFAKAISIAGDFSKVRLLAAVGDMTGDGWPDLMGQPGVGAMRIYPGAGVNGLRTSYVAHSAIDAGRQVAVGRWDGDGAPDSLFRKGSKLTLFRGNGPGGFTKPKALTGSTWRRTTG